MPNIGPDRGGVHEPLSDAELAALGLVEVELELTPGQLRAVRRAAREH
jgi:hypothetical protein